MLFWVSNSVSQRTQRSSPVKLLESAPASVDSGNGSCGTAHACDGVDGQGDGHSTAHHAVGSHISQRTLAEVGSASALAAVLEVDMDACDDKVCERVVVPVENECRRCGCRHPRPYQSNRNFKYSLYSH